MVLEPATSVPEGIAYSKIENQILWVNLEVSQPLTIHNVIPIRRLVSLLIGRPDD